MHCHPLLPASALFVSFSEAAWVEKKTPAFEFGKLSLLASVSSLAMGIITTPWKCSCEDWVENSGEASSPQWASYFLFLPHWVAEKRGSWHQGKGRVPGTEKPFPHSQVPRVVLLLFRPPLASSPSDPTPNLILWGSQRR